MYSKNEKTLGDYGGPNSGVIWVTGFSASGKTTVGRKLEARLRALGLNTIFLDGDELRSIFAERWGYERHERVDLAKVYFRLCSHLSSQGFIVVIAAVAMYDDVREWLKKNVPNSVEAYLDVPEDIRVRRDEETKKIYKKQGNMELMYDRPQAPDLVIDNHGAMSADLAADDIVSFFSSYSGESKSDRGKGKHWNSFYSEPVAPVVPTPFAEHVADQLKAESSLLEVGCGNGRDSAFFARQGHSVTAIDPSNVAIEYCRNNYENAKTRFVAGTTAALVEDHFASFSVVYSRFVIHAMTPSEENDFLDQVVRILKPGGELYLEFRSINDPMARKGEVISPTERIHGHYRRFIVMDDFVAKIEARGLKILNALESDGLAVFGDEDPVVIRIHAEKA
jgi:adenylylsulfate kinase-like enzyme/2-polyprenyl-3-methyl-5-hydroxy-6-metoxy-1,4-benzoquinol methylase